MKKLFAKSRKKLTFDETQEVITPFAFTLDNRLFGTAIASPYKRGVALIIDMVLIAILSSAGGELLAIALAVLAFRAGRTPKAEIISVTNDAPNTHQPVKIRGVKRRFLMRSIGAILVLVVLLDTFAPMVNNFMGNNLFEAQIINAEAEERQNKNGLIEPPGEDNQLEDKAISFAQALQITGLSLKILADAQEKQCQSSTCWQDVFKHVPQQIVDLNFSEQQAQKLLTEIVDATELPINQKRALNNALITDFHSLLSQTESISSDSQMLLKEVSSQVDRQDKIAPFSDKDTQVLITETSPQSTAYEHNMHASQVEHADQALIGPKANVKEQINRPVYSIVKLIKGIVDDLGLGFGWAALYFTFFTAKWHGQTPGKKLVGIRVQQLDGTPLSMWDSFGRYGGYGAGIATGLLGFLQIFWDPNRQAIHDKISATVVTDNNKIVDPDIVEVAQQRIREFNARHHQSADGQIDGSEIHSPVK